MTIEELKQALEEYKSQLETAQKKNEEYKSQLETAQKKNEEYKTQIETSIQTENDLKKTIEENQSTIKQLKADNYDYFKRINFSSEELDKKSKGKFDKAEDDNISLEDLLKEEYK